MSGARLVYAASETDADILYPTGFFAPDPFLFVQAYNYLPRHIEEGSARMKDSGKTQ